MIAALMLRSNSTTVSFGQSIFRISSRVTSPPSRSRSICTMRNCCSGKRTERPLCDDNFRASRPCGRCDEGNTPRPTDGGHGHGPGAGYHFLPSRSATVAVRLATCQSALLDLGRRNPGVYPLFYPDRRRGRADASALTAKIDDHPPSFPELDVFNLQRGEFLPAQSARAHAVISLERPELTRSIAFVALRNFRHDRSICAIRVQAFDSLAQRCVYLRILGIPVGRIH
jgi:hypothetical protein